MSNEVINPYQTFRDDNGIVLANGTVTFYVNTTTTLDSIFSDEALTVAQNNPYTLDAYGRIAGNVRFSGKKTLKIATAAGAHVRTLDNVQTSMDSSETVRPFATLSLAVASTTLEDGDVLNIAEHTAGNGGGAMWDVVLSSTVTENTYNIVQCTGVATLSLVLRLTGILNVKEIGASKNVADNMPIFQAACDVSRSVMIPDDGGEYPVDNNTAFLNITNNDQVLWGRGLIKRSDDALPIVEIIGTQTTKIENVKITGLRWLADSSIDVGTTNGDSANGVFRAAYVENFQFTNNTLNNITMGVVCADSAGSNVNWQTTIGTDYSTVTDSNMTDGVIISGNRCYDGSSYDRDTQVTGNVHCLVLGFTKNFQVFDNQMLGYKAGTFCCGGQNNNATGAGNNVKAGSDVDDPTTLKCHTGVLHDNIVDTTHVGMWVWTARDIKHHDNIVSNCMVESFDAEASADISFTGNKVLGAKGQILNLFYDCKNITLEHNECTIDISDDTGDVVLNSLQDTTESTRKMGAVYIRHNKFTVIGTVGAKSVATIQMNGADSWVFEHNECENCMMFAFGGYGQASIRHNRFLNTRAITLTAGSTSGVLKCQDPIKASASKRINLYAIEGNEFIATGTMIDTKAALELYHSSNDMTFSIKNNTMSGHQYLYNFTAGSVTSLIASAFNHVILTVGNTIDQTQTQPAIIQDNALGLTDARMISIWRDNKDENGADVYGTNPATSGFNMYFSIGSRVEITPVAAGTEGLVCTTSGPRGNATFKTYGTIQA